MKLKAKSMSKEAYDTAYLGTLTQARGPAQVNVKVLHHAGHLASSGPTVA